jgi:hypothetical protein
MPGRQQRRGIEAYDRYVQFSQVPMTALAFLMIPVLLIPLVRPVHGALAVSFDAAGYVIWALFAADYCVRFTLAPDRRSLAPASATPARSSGAGDCTTWWAW